MSPLLTDLLRVVAAFGIMFNHTSWNWFAAMGRPHEDYQSWFAAIGNQAGKASVLFFIFLSGYVLTRHRMHRDWRPGYFLGNRVFRIMPLYLLLSVFFLIYSGRYFSEFGTDLLFGRGYYHLYFIPLIMLMYLLFPLLRRHYLSTRLWISIAVAGLLVHLMVSYFLGRPVILTLGMGSAAIAEARADMSQFKILLMWSENIAFALPVFLAGMVVAEKLKSASAFSSRKVWVAGGLVFLTFLLVFADFYTRVLAGSHADPAGRIWRVSVVLNAAAWVYFLSRFPEKKSSPWLRNMARASFLVFLIHPFFLSLAAGFQLWAKLGFVFVLSWVFSLAVVKLALMNSFAGFWLGEGDRVFHSHVYPYLNRFDEKVKKLLTRRNIPPQITTEVLPTQKN